MHVVHPHMQWLVRCCNSYKVNLLGNFSSYGFSSKLIPAPQLRNYIRLLPIFCKILLQKKCFSWKPHISWSLHSCFGHCRGFWWYGPVVFQVMQFDLVSQPEKFPMGKIDFFVRKLISLLQDNEKATNQLTWVRKGRQKTTGQQLNIYITHKLNAVASSIIDVHYLLRCSFGVVVLRPVFEVKS